MLQIASKKWGVLRECRWYIVWMEEILHQLIGGKHPIILQGFHHPQRDVFSQRGSELLEIERRKLNFRPLYALAIPSGKLR